MSNITLISADLTTHLKIVGVAVIASVVAGLIGFNARGMQATLSSRLEPVLIPSGVGGGVAQSNRYLPASTRGSSRTNNPTSGGSNVQFQPG